MKKILAILLVVTAAVVCGYAAVWWEDEFFVAEPIENYAEWQEQILDEYETTQAESIRARNAFILSRLWKKGLLREEIKDFLAAKYYKLVLLQVHSKYQRPAWTVQCQQSFPFPSVWVHFTPTEYKNGEVVWAPDKPQKSLTMSVNSSTITSRTGGKYENGDVIFYEMKVQEKTRQGVVWETIIATNEVVLQGLREKGGAPERMDSEENLNQ